MSGFLIVILIIAMIAVVVALVRGIIAFLQSTEADLKSSGDGPSPNQLKQQTAMRNRILFQGIAVLVVALLLAMSKA